jgi:GDP-L-fucose synthase
MENNFKIKHILVTGGSGLVGKALESIELSFRPEYHFMFSDSKKCNLLNFEETFLIFNAIKPDYVIHLAACVGGLFKNMRQKVKMLEDNLLINTNVLKCSHLIGVKKMICCLSTCIFPDNITNINESMINNGPPHPSNEGYAYAKRLLEIQCKCYNQQYGTKYICIIPTNIYGPFDNFNLEDSHVIPGLIHRCFLAKDKQFVVKGTGKPLRQFIYSIDLAKIIMEILINYNSTDSIIISPKEEYSILSVAKLINKHFNNEITTCPEYSDGQYRKTADNSKLLEFLPNFEFTDLDVGISKTVEWFKKEYPNVRT